MVKNKHVITTGMRIRLILGGIADYYIRKNENVRYTSFTECVGFYHGEGSVAKHILIVDDDALMRRSLAFNLEQAGYHTSTAESAETALSKVHLEKPDLVLLDIGLPGMDGLDAMRQLKQELDLPVIFLTARRRELDEALGLELGGDDYITKPFDLNVLLAHIKAVLRRFERTTALLTTQTASNHEPLVAGDLVVDPLTHMVTVAGKQVDLPRREFDLLHAMALQPGRVFSMDELLGMVWGAEFIGQPQVVYVHIRWLREKIEQEPGHPRRIVTVRGVGYKLVPEAG
jgi:DNA-binding response OmpR family regulator